MMRLNIFRDSYAVGSIFEAAQVKARKAGVIYGYDPATPRSDKEDGEEGADNLDEDVWYDIIYP